MASKSKYTKGLKYPLRKGGLTQKTGTESRGQLPSYSKSRVVTTTADDVGPKPRKDRKSEPRAPLSDTSLVSMPEKSTTPRNPNPDILTENDALKIMEELLPAQNKSYPLGLKLNLKDYEVEAIHKEYSNPQDRLLHTIIAFLQQETREPTWRTIVEALRSPAVNKMALASRMKAAHVHERMETCTKPAASAFPAPVQDPTSQQRDSSQQQQTTGRTVEHLPKVFSTTKQVTSVLASRMEAAHVPECMETCTQSAASGQQQQTTGKTVEPEPKTTKQVTSVGRRSGRLAVVPAKSSAKVEIMINGLEKKFNDLKNNIRECLEKSWINVRKVVDVLTSLSPDEDECNRTFLESRVKTLVETADNFKLFIIMNFHWSYLDPSLLGHLVRKLDLKEVNIKIQSYERDLQQFRKNTPLALFFRTQKRHIDPKPGFKTAVARFKWPEEKGDDVTLEDVEQFRQKYAPHYKLHEFAMMLAEVQHGSYIVTWFIPDSIVEKLKQKVPRELLEKYYVIKLEIAKFCVYPSFKSEAPRVPLQRPQEKIRNTAKGHSVFSNAKEVNTKPTSTKTLDGQPNSEKLQSHPPKLKGYQPSTTATTGTGRQQPLEPRGNLSKLPGRPSTAKPNKYLVTHGERKGQQQASGFLTTHTTAKSSKKTSVTSTNLDRSHGRNTINPSKQTNVGKTSTAVHVHQSEEKSPKRYRKESLVVPGGNSAVSEKKVYNMPSLKKYWSHSPPKEKKLPSNPPKPKTQEQQGDAVQRYTREQERREHPSLDSSLSHTTTNVATVGPLPTSVGDETHEQNYALSIPSSEVSLAVQEEKPRYSLQGRQRVRDSQDQEDSGIIVQQGDAVQRYTREQERREHPSLDSSLSHTTTNVATVGPLPTSVGDETHEQNYALSIPSSEVSLAVQEEKPRYSLQGRQRVRDSQDQEDSGIILQQGDAVQRYTREQERREHPSLDSSLSHTTTNVATVGPLPTSVGDETHEQNYALSIPSSEVSLAVQEEKPRYSLQGRQRVRDSQDQEDSGIILQQGDAVQRYTREQERREHPSLDSSLSHTTTNVATVGPLPTSVGDETHEQKYALLIASSAVSLPVQDLMHSAPLTIHSFGKSKGFDIIAENTVEVTNTDQHIIWEEYGLRLHIPSNSLPEGFSQFQLKIEVGLSGDFEFPENGVPVSAIYSISHDLEDEKLRQPVILEMKHCATTEVLDNLRIIRAKNSNKFEYLPGGDFTSVQGYGVIKLQTFSFLSIFKRRSRRIFPIDPIEYSVNIYYTKIGYLQFHFQFFIIKKLSALAKAIEEEISKQENSCERGATSNFQFHKDVVSFLVPESSNGWNMVAINPLKVLKKNVDSYTREIQLCPCEVKVWWEGEGTPKQLIHELIINGSRKWCNFVTVTSPARCLVAEAAGKDYPSATSRQMPSSTSPPKLDDEINQTFLTCIARDYVTNWEPLGPYLDLSQQQETEIRQNHKDNYGLQKQECLKVWQEVKGAGATYRALISAAEKAKNQQLADRVRSLLESQNTRP